MPDYTHARNRPHADYYVLLLFGALLLFGLIMLTSASSVIGFEKFQDTYFFIKRQLFFGVLPGFFALLFFSKISPFFLKRLGTLFFYATLMTLVAVLIPGVGQTLNTGARSWFIFGGFSVQPAEFAKLGLIFFLAHYISQIGETLTDFKQGFLPALLIGMIPVGLVILQPDLGTASILFTIVFGMLFVAKASWRHLGGLAGLAVIGFLVLILVAPYRAARFTTFLNPNFDPQGIGYHINQAYVAVGSGGWFGRGIGDSKQKYQYLPEVHADSIFAVMAEEIGFIFTFLFLLLLLGAGLRALRIARHAPDAYSSLLVSGIVVWIMAQSFFNISAMVGLMPITGVPLPFVSHGGTALMIAMAAVGVIVNVSKRSHV